MDVVPRSAASGTGRIGLMSIRFRFPDGGGHAQQRVWRQASRQRRARHPPEDGAIRVAGSGVPSKTVPGAPQRPSPEHSTGGDSSPDSQIVWASVCPASTGRMVEAG
ncbi:MAG: hypothetical protein ACLRWP_10290 [Bilophila wadsworthia]